MAEERADARSPVRSPVPAGRFGCELDTRAASFLRLPPRPSADEKRETRRPPAAQRARPVRSTARVRRSYSGASAFVGLSDELPVGTKTGAGPGEMRADQQHVVVGVRGGHDLNRRETERAGPVDALESRGLVRGAVGPGPGAPGGARVAAVDVATEDDRARGRSTFEDGGELGALRVVAGRAARRACGEVGGAHVDADAGRDAHPAAPLPA